MFYIILAAHAVICIVLVILIVVLQEGKDLGATFGAGSSNSLFGASGMDKPIVRITTGVAIIFMLTSIVLVRLYNVPTTASATKIALPEELMKINKSIEAQKSMEDVKKENPEAALPPPVAAPAAEAPSDKASEAASENAAAEPAAANP